MAATCSNASTPANTFIGFPSNAFFTMAYFPISPITTILGTNCKACSINKDSLECAVKTSATNNSGCAAITSSVCLPIEPVDPKIAILFCCIPTFIIG